MNYYNLNSEQTIKKLKSQETGLTEEEALNRLKNNGLNKINEEKKESKLKKFLNEFNNIMIIILIISSIISFVISYLNNESYLDSIVIISIVIINAILGYIQEIKSDKALDNLKKMQITQTKVKRDNKIYLLNSENLVNGDIIILEAGDIVPADARIIWEASLKTDESTLTGESIAVSKEINALIGTLPIAERKNMIFAGTTIVYGKCIAIICETGMNTEFGNIAKHLNKEKKDLTPLEKKINNISKFLSIVIAIIIIIMFIIGIMKDMKILDILMLSISLAVAAIPEGLPAIITITLSIGIFNMAKKKAIIRKMTAVETLGCTEVICSDKTGTITQNQMIVKEIYVDEKILNVNDLSDKHIIISAAILNNDVEKNNEKYIGDPTEIALYKMVEDKKININNYKKEHPRINELPFDSERKMMSTIHKNIIYTKGSFDSIIKCCSHIIINGTGIKLNSTKKEELKQIELKEAEKAYRVLAFAYKKISNNYNLDEIEKDLTFIGMICMIDPPRENVKYSIDLCKSANIKPIMITGDSLSTAKSIAKNVGILNNENEIITGAELDKLNNEELKDAVKKYSVYARVSPINKLAIVNAWKENNVIVAMTGDGINDAPALKAANIGIGMGISGTEVTKSVSDIVLSDDSFSTIVSAIREGRRIYDNIRNVLIYLLAGNIAEILVVFIGILFSFEILKPIQLLYLNLITDTLPAISLAFEKEEKNIMKRKVRKNNNNFFTPYIIAKLLISAILKTITILLIYFINLKLYSIEIATSLAFLTLILLETTYAYHCKNLKENVINKNIFDNRFMNKSMIILIILNIVIFFSPLKAIFNISQLNFIQIGFSILIVFLMFIIDELFKNILVKLFKDE